ncbi:MAG: RNA polymerase factor sigma-54, partial [Comamonas sp.]|nr:RNA polymerase factor sigma-54 [Comamonas sp.]
MKPGLSLKVSQQLQLTPQLQQSIRLLQLSSLELAQEVAQLLQDNPFIEQAEQEEDGQGEAAPSPTSTEAPLDAEDWGQPPDPAALSAPLDWQTGA